MAREGFDEPRDVIAMAAVKLGTNSRCAVCFVEERLQQS